VGAVPALFCISIPTATVLVDVASCVVSSLVVDGEDECRLFPSWGRLLMDRHLFFVLGRLFTFFCGRPSMSRGRALGLLNFRYLEQGLHLVSNAPRLGVRRLGHITQQHCRRHNVLARSRESADGLLRLSVSDDLPMYLSSPSADTSARRVRQVLLEDLFKQNKALTIFVELCFELSQLCDLRGSVFLWRGVDLTVIPRCPGVLPCCRDSTTCNGILCLVGGFHCPVDVEALPSRVVAIGLRARVRLGGVEASTSFLQQPLPE